MGTNTRGVEIDYLMLGMLVQRINLLLEFEISPLGGAGGLSMDIAVSRLTNTLGDATGSGGIDIRGSCLMAALVGPVDNFRRFSEDLLIEETPLDRPELVEVLLRCPEMLVRRLEARANIRRPNIHI